jgi:uncharacterized protein
MVLQRCRSVTAWASGFPAAAAIPPWPSLRAYWPRSLPTALLRAFVSTLLLHSLLLTTGCAWLDAKQRNIIYRPTPGIPAEFAGLRTGDERYFVAHPAHSANAMAAASTATATADMPTQDAGTHNAGALVRCALPIVPVRNAPENSPENSPDNAPHSSIGRTPSSAPNHAQALRTPLAAHPPATIAVATVCTDPAAQRVEIWWLPHATPGAPTLLYLHGTFRNLFQNQTKIEALRSAGFSVLAVEYRGWGTSSPLVPSERTIIADAGLAWQELVRREPRARQRVVYGHSMGSGVAVDLASRLRSPQDYGGLILESAFTSFKDIAQGTSFWLRILASFNHENFASIDKIAQVQAPVLMLHGTADKTIPIAYGQKLFAAIPAGITPATPTATKTFVSVEGGGHSDLHYLDAASYQTALQGFAKQLSP